MDERTAAVQRTPRVIALRALAAIACELLGWLVAVSGAALWAWPLGLVAFGAFLIWYVAPLVEYSR